MLMQQFKPFVISPCDDQLERCYWLENGFISMKALVMDKNYFECDSPCLALVDYEIVNNNAQITQVHLIATNVDKVTLLSWLYATQESLIGYLVILIALITKVSDDRLRADLVAIIFHDQLHPRHLLEGGGGKMNSLYASLIVVGQKAFLKCQHYTCSQRLRDTLLVNCLLKNLAKNELISCSSEYENVKMLIKTKLDSLQV